MYNIAINQWFLNAYVIVMCLAPIVNLAIDRMAVKDIWPLLLCAFGWSFATTLPVISKYVPAPSGLTAYSFLTLLSVYVVARFVRRMSDNGARLMVYAANGKIVLPVVAMCLVLAAIGLNDYNSPFSIIIAGCALLMFKDLHVPKWIGRVCAWLGPSMFSVYLLHSHGQGWGYLRVIQDWLLDKGLSLGVAYILTALSVFIVCLVADLPRRFAAILFKKTK